MVRATVEAIDADGKVVENGYDPNSNVILSTSTQVCTITQPTAPDEVFQVAMRHDSLDRPVVVARRGRTARSSR